MLQLVKNKIITSDVVDFNGVMKCYYHMQQVDNVVWRIISNKLYVVGPIPSMTKDVCFFDVYNDYNLVFYAALFSCRDGTFMLRLNHTTYKYFNLHILMRIVKFASLTMRQYGLKPKEVFLDIDARYGESLPFTLKTFKRHHA